MSSLKPTHIVHDVASINALAFHHFNPKIAGIPWDLDKTLVGQHEFELPGTHQRVLEGFSRLSIWQGIISNASSAERTERVENLAAYIGKQIGDDFFAVTSSMVGGKRKPNRAMFDLAAERASLAAASMAHVGDQIFKDVLGANRAGYGAGVLVNPYGRGDDWRVKYLQRPVEFVLRPALGVPVFASQFPRGIEAI